MSTVRPFGNYLVDRMQAELEQRKSEYLEDRKRAHARFKRTITSMHDELFMYRTTAAAKRLLEAVDTTVKKLTEEQDELSEFQTRWK